MGQELLEAAAGAGDSHLWHVGSRLAHVIGASGRSTRTKAMVALWHQGEGKGLVIDTHDLRALVDEMKDNNKGYVVVGVKPIGQVDYALLKEVRGADP
jgi:hypothetical protein